MPRTDKNMISKLDGIFSKLLKRDFLLPFENQTLKFSMEAFSREIVLAVFINKFNVSLETGGINKSFRNQL